MLKLSTIAAAVVSLTAVAVRADPATWTADSRLHQSLWGIAYTSQDSAYYPQCGDTIAEVVGDVQLMSQLTTRIRLYGTDCDQFLLVQQAIQQTKTNLHVFPGIYIDGNETTYTRQRDQLFQVLDTYGLDNVLGITVGNEYLLQAYTADPNSLATAQTYLLSKITDVRTTLASKNYNRTIPVGSADAGSQITATYAAACDYVMANTHPFFSGVTIDGAAQWTAQYLIDQQPNYATAAGKTLYSAEIGWPTGSIAGGDLSANGSIASVANTQTLLDTFVCNANSNITAGGPYDHGYFWFELFDQEWKVPYGGAEPFWGLFDQNRTLKALTIPTCLAAAEAPVGTMGSNTGGGATATGTASATSGSTGGGSHSGALSISPSHSMVLIGAISMLFAAVGGGVALL